MTRLLREEDTSTHIHPPGTEVEVLVMERDLVRVRRVSRVNCGGRYCDGPECDERAFYTRRDNLELEAG